MRTLRISLLLSLFTLYLPIAPAQNTSSTPAATLPGGVVLPNTGTVFAVVYKGSDPEPVQLHPSEASVNGHAAGNFARGLVYMNPHATVELKGQHSATSLSDGHDSFFIRIGSSDDVELQRERIHLIRLDETENTRVVTRYSQNIFGGQRRKKFNDIPIAKSTVKQSSWLKIMPEKPLPPGEYGIVFMPKDPIASPDVVYDFNVPSEKN